MSRSLHNNHNVYVLGAGFSREANMPLIRDFLFRMRDSHEWLVAQERHDEAQAVQDVLNFRLSAAAAAYWTQLDLENIEELFSLASSNSNSLTKKIQLAIAATLEHAAHHARNEPRRFRFQNHVLAHSDSPGRTNVPWLQHRADQNVHEVNPYVHHLAKLLGMFRDGKVQGENTFITFNYDTILERALESLGLSYGYALDPDRVEIHSSCRAKAASDLNILKLHGSVNWARNDSNRGLTLFGSYGDLRSVNRQPELIPPTWKKIFEDQLAHVWEQAVVALRSATRVIVIGFSIPPTDTHFKYLLAAGLQQNLSLRQIAFFNPGNAIDGLKARASSLLRTEYIQNGLISFHALGLSEFAEDQQVLAQIGRPVWLVGDSGTMGRY